MTRSEEIAKEVEQIAVDCGCNPDNRLAILAFSVGMLSQRLADLERKAVFGYRNSGISANGNRVRI